MPKKNIFGKVVKVKDPNHYGLPRYIGFGIKLRVYINTVTPKDIDHPICSEIYDTIHDANCAIRNNNFMLVDNWAEASDLSKTTFERFAVFDTQTHKK